MHLHTNIGVLLRRFLLHDLVSLLVYLHIWMEIGKYDAILDIGDEASPVLVTDVQLLPHVLFPDQLGLEVPLDEHMIVWPVHVEHSTFAAVLLAAGQASQSQLFPLCPLCIQCTIILHFCFCFKVDFVLMNCALNCPC